MGVRWVVGVEFRGSWGHGAGGCRGSIVRELMHLLSLPAPCIVLYLPPVLNPTSYDGALVLEADVA